jgi:hypothetical protein
VELRQRQKRPNRTTKKLSRHTANAKCSRPCKRNCRLGLSYSPTGEVLTSAKEGQNSTAPNIVRPNNLEATNSDLNSAFDNEDTTTGDRPAESETTESKGEPVPYRNKRGKTKIDYEWLHKNETTKLYHTNEQLDPNRFIKAKRTELQSIDEFGVLEVLTQRQTTEIKKAGKQIISTRMDEIDKTTGKGVYDKTKSRLLVRGDLDKTQDLATEATTTRLQTFLLLVNYAVSKAMNYAVDDVKIAFCRAKIDREVYVKLDKTTTEI